MRLLKEKLKALMNEQGELYFEQIKLRDEISLEKINNKIDNLTEEIYETSNEIFDLENKKQ